jgi:hypothetical protein
MTKQKLWQYETGLGALAAQLGDPSARASFDSLATALRDNQREQSTFGSTPALRAAHAEIIRRLNQFTLDTLGLSFNSLCVVETGEQAQHIAYDLGFAKLRSRLPAGDRAILLDFLDLEYRVWANITDQVRFGANDRTRRELADLLAALDQLALTYAKRPFAELLPPGASIHRDDASSTTDTRPRSQTLAHTVRPQFAYRAGLTALEGEITDAEGREKFQRLAQALFGNLRTEGAQGATEETRNERAHLVHELNKLALDLTGRSFNDWCDMS